MKKHKLEHFVVSAVSFFVHVVSSLSKFTDTFITEIAQEKLHAVRCKITQLAIQTVRVENGREVEA